MSVVGKVLRNHLSVNKIRQEDVGRAIGISRYSVNQLVNGHRNVTAEMALRLAALFGTTPEYWLDFQRRDDLAKALDRIGEQLSQIRPLVFRRSQG